ncbi:MAG: hypothetical protein A2W25_03560 [candidate division Zixibacteria bacterium RBG_16_53_22]|nr:MAG: hypothetical protein A2W25_03560 [candidate division Zixibacteria bacterium RBG_16_53_22]
MAKSDEKNDDSPKNESGLLFTQLVLSFQAAAWQQMGKVPSMITGKVERNLEMAKHSIDMLGMLEEKTAGNLAESEAKYLKHALFELRMNYLEEAKKGPEKKDEAPTASAESNDAPPGEPNQP